jgi:endo-beta-N-acetylglucosaminidase D
VNDIYDWLRFSIGVFFICLVMYYVGYSIKASTDRPALRHAKWANENIKFVSGDALGFGPYRIMTVDGGKSWYNYIEEDGKVIILGPADPNLVKHNADWENLAKYAEEHGSINPAHMTTEEANLLSEAGIVVEKR